MAKKTVFLATTPDGAHTVTRTSARAYTCALAIDFPPTPEEHYEGWVEAATEHDIPAEAWTALGKPSARPTAANPQAWIYWGPKVRPATPGGWSIVSFHGSAPLALKAAQQWRNHNYRNAVAVPVTTK